MKLSQGIAGEAYLLLAIKTQAYCPRYLVLQPWQQYNTISKA